MCDAIEKCDKMLDDFYRETRIWPPGRSCPMEMGDPHTDGWAVACDAFSQWKKDKARIAELEAEIKRRDSFSGCDGCSSGDCPHDTDADCIQAQSQIIAEQEAHIAKVEGDRAMCRSCEGLFSFGALTTPTPDPDGEPICIGCLERSKLEADSRRLEWFMRLFNDMRIKIPPFLLDSGRVIDRSSIDEAMEETT